MEKRTPHCSLSVIKALTRSGHVRITGTAMSTAAALELDLEAILKVVLALTLRDFHKSMTTHDDHRIWQDVYRPITTVGPVYLKLTVIDELIIVSFKELQS
jgi:motility quorum-sensing regulator/GCU-specific mRNA interferase toxin